VLDADSSYLLWDKINHRLGIGSTTPATALDVGGTATATLFSGSGASLTALNAGNLASGTVGTARLGSGTASASTFLRGDQTWAAEADPKISTLTSGKWCSTNGSVVTCTQDAPSTSAAGSTGYVQFNSANAFAGDSGLFWDNTNKRLGIGSAAPTQKLDVAGNLTVPFIYDRDNTGYYVDPNSNSRMANGYFDDNLINWPGYNGITQAYGHYFWPGRLDGSGANWQQSWYLGSHSSYGLFTNTGMYFSGATFAPLMYSIYNTGYYVQPHSTSRMYLIQSDYRYTSYLCRIDGSYCSDPFYLWYYTIGGGCQYALGCDYGGATSDRLLKKEINPINSPLKTVMRLHPIAFYWKEGTEQAREDKRLQYGLIAQEVQEILPAVVKLKKMLEKIPPAAPVNSEHPPLSGLAGLPAARWASPVPAPPAAVLPNDSGSREKPGDMLTLEYNELIPFVVGAIAELKAQNDGYKKSELQNLRKEFEALKVAHP